MPTNSRLASPAIDSPALASPAPGSRAFMRRAPVVAAAVAAMLILGAGASAKPPGGAAQPSFGPNVLVFDPSMPTTQIQAAVDAIAAQQVSNQFGPQRYALLFKPGT